MMQVQETSLASRSLTSLEGQNRFIVFLKTLVQDGLLGETSSPAVGQLIEFLTENVIKKILWAYRFKNVTNSQILLPHHGGPM